MTDIDLLPSDLPYRLPAEAYAYLLRDLARALPPPPDPSEETKTLRKQSLIAQISALCPNDAIEAGLAADHIIATEQSRESNRWVQIYRANGEHRLASQAQAHGVALMREAKRALREIHRLQAETRARHADPAATDTAERIEHIAMVMTAEAVQRMPEPAMAEPYVPQRAAPKASVAKTDPKSHETKTENSAETTRATPRKRRSPRPARPGSVRAPRSGLGPTHVLPRQAGQSAKTRRKPRTRDNCLAAQAVTPARGCGIRPGGPIPRHNLRPARRGSPLLPDCPCYGFRKKASAADR